MTLQWSDRFRVGQEQIDQQHQYLFKLIGALDLKIAAGTSREDSLQTIDALVDYALQHFAEEESLMEKINFSGTTSHRWLHSEFAGKIADMALDWSQGKEITAQEIRDFLTSWLLDHILTEDMKIGEAVRSQREARV